jgi:hypothetical protein
MLPAKQSVEIVDNISRRKLCDRLPGMIQRLIRNYDGRHDAEERARALFLSAGVMKEALVAAGGATPAPDTLAKQAGH